MFWLLNSLFRLSETFKLKIREVSLQLVCNGSEELGITYQ